MSIQTYWTSLARLQQVKYKNGKEMSGEGSEEDDVATMQTCICRFIRKLKSYEY